MEKRVVLFLVISFGIIFGFDFFMKELGLLPPPPPPDEERAASSAGSDTVSGPASSLDAGSASLPPGDTGASSTDPPARIEEVETPLYRAQFTSRGAQIQSWKLKRYLTQNDGQPQPVEFVYPEGHFAGPMSVRTGDAGVTAALNAGMFEAERDFAVLDEAHPVGRLAFSLRDEEHRVVLEKEFTFHYDSYLVDVSMRFPDIEGGAEVLLGTNFGIVEWGQGFIGAMGPAWMTDGVIEKETPDPEIRRSGDVGWAALQDKYFISVIIPRDARGVVARTETDYVATTGVEFPVDAPDRRIHFQFYAGPKQFDLMQSLGRSLEDTIDFGWFIYGSWTVVKAVAKPLFYILRFLYDHTQNYGVSIILLTCGIKLLFVPLQYKSYKSMQGMQNIQPKIQALQARLKGDRERLNRETLKLYKEHRVNPVGGCLPMVLQMPVFVSLFNILYMTVDLRQAPFFLWITDLSIQDPYYVLPVLMGVSMVIQQKIMPTTMDPTQARMMLLLPVFMTFLFLTFPSGLVMYWLTNNVLTILQQVATDRFFLKKPPLAPTPAGDESGGAGPSKKKKREKPGASVRP